MTLIITKSINPDDQQELFAGLRQYNQQYLDAAQFGDLGVYSRDGQRGDAGRADCQTQGQLAVH